MRIVSNGEVARSPRMILTVFLSAIAIFGSSSQLLAQAITTVQGLAFVGGTIYVTAKADPITNGVVLVQNGKILAVGRKASLSVPRTFQSIDCSGKTITAGFWNSHVHFFERKWAKAAEIPAAELARQLEEMFTQYGFTSVFDLGSAWENTMNIRKRIESGEAPGPRIRSTGEVLIAPGAMPAKNILSILGDMPLRNLEVTSAQEAEAAAKRQIAKGVDGIKIHMQPPPLPKARLPRDGIAAAVGPAHALDKPVFIHPNSAEDVKAAIQAGVDVIAHTTPQSGPWDATVTMGIRDRKVALTPTLTMWKESLSHDRISAQDNFIAVAVGQLRAWIAAGGTVLFGTDIGAIDYDPREEYALMNRAGMSFRQILASLTTAPAAQFGDSGRLGRIAVGLEADLVVLNGEPSRDVTAFAAVSYTVRSGKIIYRSTQ